MHDSRPNCEFAFFESYFTETWKSVKIRHRAVIRAPGKKVAVRGGKKSRSNRVNGVLRVISGQIDPEIR